MDVFLFPSFVLTFMCSVNEAFLTFAETRLMFYLYVDWMVVMCMGYVYVATCTIWPCAVTMISLNQSLRELHLCPDLRHEGQQPLSGKELRCPYQ